MSGFGNFSRTAEELEREIIRYGIALGINWDDAVAVRALAREALTRSSEENLQALRGKDPVVRARTKLFALTELMLRTMRQSAEFGVHTQGGPVWKAFGRALFEEAAILGLEAARKGE